MALKKYISFDQYITELSDGHRLIVDELLFLWKQQPNIKISIKRNCLYVVFENGIWRYLNTTNKKYPILGCSRGNWIVRHYPHLNGFFDECRKVVGKITIKNVKTIDSRGMKEFFEFAAKLPHGIGVL